VHPSRFRGAALAATLVALAAGTVLGVWGERTLLRRECGGRPLLAPCFDCGHPSAIDKSGYAALEGRLRRYLDQRHDSGVLVRTAVYFRDLEDGPVFAINADERFIPASLLKLPVAIAHFAIEEEAGDLFDVELEYSAGGQWTFERMEERQPRTTGLIQGRRYRVVELLRSIIVDSDNLAYYVLIRHLNERYPEGTRKLLRTFEELGVTDPATTADETVTVRGYASLLRQLYNVSYLSADNSEKLLSWLAASTFDEGIAAGVPSDVTVADKFGERGLDDGSWQLHDCGIVYYPANPYLLCVMTKGSDWAALKHEAAEISRMVWEEVASRAR
jgi:beta-lactamase class A